MGWCHKTTRICLCYQFHLNNFIKFLSIWKAFCMSKLSFFFQQYLRHSFCYNCNQRSLVHLDGLESAAVNITKSLKEIISHFKRNLPRNKLTQYNLLVIIYHKHWPGYIFLVSHTPTERCLTYSNYTLKWWRTPCSRRRKTKRDYVWLNGV